jgi:hypothetical protein
VNGDCPTGCGRSVGHGKLMCGSCWREVPEHLQDEVYRTWRAYQRRSGTSGDSMELMQAYRAARDAAIGSVP